GCVLQDQRRLAACATVMIAVAIAAVYMSIAISDEVPFYGGAVKAPLRPSTPGTVAPPTLGTPPPTTFTIHTPTTFALPRTTTTARPTGRISVATRSTGTARTGSSSLTTARSHMAPSAAASRASG